MTAHHQFNRIDGLTGREPVGAVLTIGRKGPGGAPVDTDRFWLVDPNEAEGRIRPLLPAFEPFNSAQPDRRKSISGNLVHAAQADAVEWYLRAQVLDAPRSKVDGGGKWPTHPQMLPACTGDGDRAVRLYAVGSDGEPDDFREMPCPNELCEFRQGNVKKCKPFGRLYFRPRWAPGSPLPTPLTKWTTGSWYSVANVKGFFEHVASQAAQLGLDEWSLYGLPFTLALGRKTKPQQKRGFPVVSITPDCDLIEFFLAQRKRLAEAGGHLRLAAGARDPEEQGRAGADALSIVPGIPGETTGHFRGDIEATETPQEEPPSERSDAELRPLVAAMKNGSLQSDDVAAEAVRRWGQIPRYLTLEQLAELVAWVEAGGADPPAAAETEGRLF